MGPRAMRILLATVVVLAALLAMAVAEVAVLWDADEVTPVVLVEPWTGGFRPAGSTSMSLSWDESEVTPVVLVEPDIRGFIASEESAIRVSWRKASVTPVVLVKPSGTGFVPRAASDVQGMASDSSGGNATESKETR